MRLLVLLALGGCVLTRPPRIEERPRWRVTAGDSHEAGCASARAFVRKSGKQGIGVALRLRSHGACTFQIARAQLVFRGGRAIDVAAPPPVALAGRSQQTIWWPVAFDNNAAWNAGDNAAVLAVATPAGTWRVALEQR